MFGASDRIRTCISQLSVATEYKPAVLPLNYRGINLVGRAGFEPAMYLTYLVMSQGLSTAKQSAYYALNNLTGSYFTLLYH